MVQLPPFALMIWARLRSISGRSWRMEQQLHLQSEQLQHVVKHMSALSDKIAELSQAVDAERASRAAEVKAAVEKAKAAFEAGEKAEHDSAMAELDGMIDKLTAPSPAFSPSAN